MSQTVALPWMPKECSPNWRGHWAVKARAAKKYRQDCFYLARIAWIGVPSWDGPIDVDMGFHPPSKRKYDIDNAIASCKGLLDGIADAMKVNDHRFRIKAVIGDPNPPAGRVWVTIRRGA